MARAAMRMTARRRWPQLRSARGLVTVLGLCAVTAGVAGCDHTMNGFFNSFVDPSQVGSYGLFGREGTLDIRRSLSLQDAPGGVTDASDPQAEDLVPVVEEYKYRIGDAITIRIFELLQRGTETAVQVVINETGSVSLPVMGRLEVVGLTLPEIEAELSDQLVRRGILVDPEIMVEPAVRRGLSYTLYGQISQPNLYPLGQYDLRLLDAINVAGGLLDSVTQIYVVRQQELPEPVLLSGGVSRDRTAGRAPNGASLTLSDGHSNGAGGGRVALATARSDPAQREGATTAPLPREGRTPQWIYRNGDWVEVLPDSVPTPAATAPPAGKAARDDLIDTMIGGPTTTAAATTSTPAEPVSPSPSQPRWIYYNGKWVETEAPATSPAAATAPSSAEIRDRPTQPSIDWEEVAGVREQRVIKISASALRDGDPRQNIVVRAGDAIRLAAGEFGEYYLMGHVSRPGAYSLTGRETTLKTAIAAAGNLGPLAWPTHCTVYRRLGDREEMIQVNLDAIFAGKEQDFFIKKDDLILVGTSPVAMFLAVLRNAFRISYGFGFVYDRNFADIDRFGGRPNPDSIPDRLPNLFR